MKKEKINVSDEELIAMYCEKKMRLKDIASVFGCTASAVSQKLKKAGVATRSPHDYPTSEKARAAWVEIGKRSKGKVTSEETRRKQSDKMKGRRMREDYEFGGHEKKRRDGYIIVYVPDHPNCTKDGFVMKHILVMEKSIGRYLEPGECVHHINHIRDDNRIENLKLMSASEHMSMHMKERHENRRKNKC